MYERFRPYILVSPALLVILVLFIGGLFFGLTRSFNYMPIIGLNDPNLDAYRSIFTSSGFLRSLGLTLWIAIASTFISMTIAIGVGLGFVFSVRDFIFVFALSFFDSVLDFLVVVAGFYSSGLWIG